MKKKSNIIITKKLIVYNALKMVMDVVKIPSYLLDMVVLEKKKIIIKSQGYVVIELNRYNIEDRITKTESREYPGKLFQKDITYHLVHIDVSKQQQVKESYVATA